MIKIKTNKTAEKDLDNIFNNIAKDKPNSATEYVAEILNFILLLKTNPEMGIDCRKKGLNRDCRVLFYKNYMIQYKIYKNQISIKRVINTKQNYKG